MPDAVVLPHKRTGLRELAREIRRRRLRPEGRGVALVLEHDHEDVLDGRRGARGRRRHGEHEGTDDGGQGWDARGPDHARPTLPWRAAAV